MTSKKFCHSGPISSSMTGRKYMRAASYNVMLLAKSLFENRRYVELSVSGRLFSSRNILIPFVSCSLTQPPWATTSTAKRGVPPISQLRFSSMRLGSFRLVFDIVQGLPQPGLFSPQRTRLAPHVRHPLQPLAPCLMVSICGQDCAGPDDCWSHNLMVSSFQPCSKRTSSPLYACFMPEGRPPTFGSFCEAPSRSLRSSPFCLSWSE
jgi:hypothetical protein